MTTVQTRKDLIERLRHHRDDLRRLGVRRIGLFGSFLLEDELSENETLKRAFVRGIEVIGEATKNLSTDLRDRYSEVDW